MITISIYKDKQNCINKFTVNGHAGFAKKGKDIICAAVSVTAYNAINALNEMLGIKDFAKKNFIEQDGYMECIIPNDLSEEKKIIASIILQTIEIGFKQIEFSYKNYVRVLELGGV